jgi:cyclase
MREFAIIALLSFAIGSVAQDQDFGKVQIKVTKVSGNIYMLQGAGGNIAASVGEDGIVIVDDQYAPLADMIAAALKGIGVTDKPVRFVINTHYHGDHTGGNLPFATNGSTVIAQDNVRKRLETGGQAGIPKVMERDQPAAPKGGLPIITFDHDVTVHLNGEDIRALHFPAGHTDATRLSFSPRPTSCTWVMTSSPMDIPLSTSFREEACKESSTRATKSPPSCPAM